MSKTHKKYGVSEPKETQPYDRVVTLSDLRSNSNKRGQNRIPGADALIDLLESHHDQIISLNEKGVTGTSITDGRIRIDPNPERTPYILRGIMGNPGDYEEAYRDSQVFKSVNEIRNLSISAIWGLHAPSEASDIHKEHTDWVWKKLEGIEVADGITGFDALLEHILSFLIHGFSIFEVIWARNERGWVYPESIMFREQSTVWRWVMDGRNDRLIAAQMRVAGDSPLEYTLSTGVPEDITSRELLAFSLNRRGNNFEGISPLRPVLHWTQFKLLLSRIAAATYDAYGVPIKTIRNALEAVMAGKGASDESLDDVLDAILAVEEGEASAIKLPNGAVVDVLQGQGTVPDLQPFLQYCDFQITSVFSSEGSLLGFQKVGSFALSQTNDAKFLSQIPAIERAIAEPVNAFVRSITRQNIGPQDEYAKLAMRFDPARSNDKFFEQVRSLLESGFWLYPKDVQDIVLEEMGLPLDIFDGWSPDALVAFLNGKKGGPLVQNHECGHVINNDEQVYEEPDPANGNLDVDKAEKLMDRAENRLAKRLHGIAREHHKALVDELREADDV
jgi:hypothetical protein